MASAWGLSWGRAWGDSWGILDEVPLTPPVTPAVPKPSGGILPWYARPKKKRRKYTDEDVAKAVIEAVAQRQALALELEEQKRLEELVRELDLKAIEWESRYLELMNEERQRLIDAEIGKLLRKKVQDDEAISLLLSMLV